MKNLLEELRNINNEDDYDVPANFRDKVIERIKEEKSTSRIRYIIPALSAAAVVLIAVIISTNGKTNDFINSKIDLISEESIIETDGAENYLTNSEYDNLNSYNDTFITSESSQAFRNESKKALLDKEYFDEIVNMLKINNISAEEKDNIIKAHGKKEEVETVLYYFLDNIEIIQDGEYVIIKEK